MTILALGEHHQLLRALAVSLAEASASAESTHLLNLSLQCVFGTVADVRYARSRVAALCPKQTDVSQCDAASGSWDSRHTQGLE